MHVKIWHVQPSLLIIKDTCINRYRLYTRQLDATTIRNGIPRCHPIHRRCANETSVFTAHRLHVGGDKGRWTDEAFARFRNEFESERHWSGRRQRSNFGSKVLPRQRLHLQLRRRSCHCRRMRRSRRRHSDLLGRWLFSSPAQKARGCDVTNGSSWTKCWTEPWSER